MDASDRCDDEATAASTAWEHRATQTNDPREDSFSMHDPSEPWHTMSGYVLGSRDEAKALREVHHRIRQFAALLPLYLESPETFDFVGEWVGPSLPTAQAETFRQQEEDENALLAALKLQLDAKLKDPALTPEARVAFLQDVGARQKMIFLRRTQRLEESKKLQAARSQAAFARMTAATVEDDEVESDLWLSVETLVKSSIGFLGKIFVFLRSAMERQTLPVGASCTALFPGGERQRTFYGLTGGLHPQLDAVVLPRDFDALRSIVKGAELPELYRLKYSEPWNFGVGELEALRERFLKQYAAEEYRKIDARVKQMRTDALSAAEKEIQRTVARMTAASQQQQRSAHVVDGADSEAPRNARRSPPASAPSHLPAASAGGNAQSQLTTTDAMPSRGGSAGKPPLATSLTSSVAPFALDAAAAAAPGAAAAGRLPSFPPRPSSSGAASSSAVSSARGDTPSSDDAIVSSALLRASIGSNVSPGTGGQPLEPQTHNTAVSRDERSGSMASTAGVEGREKRAASVIRLSPREDEFVRDMDDTASGVTAHPSAPVLFATSSATAPNSLKTVTVTVDQPRQQYHSNMFHGLQDEVAREAAQTMTATTAQTSWAAAATLVHAKRQLANVAGSLEERAAQRAAGRRGTLPATSTHATAPSEPPQLPSPLSEALDGVPAATHDANAFEASWRRTEDGRRELVVSPLRPSGGAGGRTATHAADASPAPSKPPHREGRKTSPIKRRALTDSVQGSRGPPSALTGPLAELAAKLQHQREIDTLAPRGAELGAPRTSDRGRAAAIGARSAGVHERGRPAAETEGTIPPPRANVAALLAPIRPSTNEELADHTVATTISEQLMVEAMIHSRLQRLHLDRRGVGAQPEADIVANTAELQGAAARVGIPPVQMGVPAAASGAAVCVALTQPPPATTDTGADVFATDVPTARRSTPGTANVVVLASGSGTGTVRGTAATAVPSLTRPSRRYQNAAKSGSAKPLSRNAEMRHEQSGSQSASTAHARAAAVTTTTTLGAPIPVPHCSVRNAFAAQPLPSLAAHYYQPSAHAVADDSFAEIDGHEGAAPHGTRKGGGVIVHSATTATSFAEHVAKVRLQQRIASHADETPTDELFRGCVTPAAERAEPTLPQCSSRPMVEDDEYGWTASEKTVPPRGPQPFPASHVRRGQSGSAHDGDLPHQDPHGHGSINSGFAAGHTSSSRREDLSALMRDTVHTVVALDHATMRIAVPKPAFSYLT